MSIKAEPRDAAGELEVTPRMVNDVVAHLSKAISANSLPDLARALDEVDTLPPSARAKWSAVSNM